MSEPLQRLFLLLDRLQLYHGEVAAALEITDLVEDVGDPTAHACGEIAAGLSQYHDDAAGHVFAAMVTRALDNSHRARITHRETFPCHTPEIALAGNCTVKNSVADDNVVLGNEGGFLRWGDH